MLTDSTAQSAELSTLVNLVRLAFLIAGPIVGMIFGLWVARGLHRSISQISVTLNDATGDLNREVGSVEVRNPADLPGLHQQVQAVATRLRQVMDELQQTRRQAMLADRLAAVGRIGGRRGPRTAQSADLRQAADPNRGATPAVFVVAGQAASGGAAGDRADGEHDPGTARFRPPARVAPRGPRSARPRCAAP